MVAVMTLNMMDEYRNPTKNPTLFMKSRQRFMVSGEKECQNNANQTETYINPSKVGLGIPDFLHNLYPKAANIIPFTPVNSPMVIFVMNKIFPAYLFRNITSIPLFLNKVVMLRSALV